MKLLRVLIVLVSLRVFFWFTAFPNSDEAYYWWWSKISSSSYYDHPPLFAWLQSLVTLVFNNSLFGLRLSNLFTNCLFFYTYWHLLQYLYGSNGRSYFITILVIILCSPLYFVMLALAWHDHLLITLCLASSYWLLMYLDSYLYEAQPRDWQFYLAVWLISLAVITKYNALLMGLGFLATILSQPQLRLLVTFRRVTITSGIIFITLSPVIVWNFQNNFPSFNYYLNRSLEGGDPIQRILEPLGFLGISIIMVSPFISWLFWRAGRLNLQLREGKTIYYQLAWSCFFSSTVILGIVSLFSTAYYYWNITAYLLLFPLLPSLIKHKNFYRPLVSYGIIFALLFTFNYTVFPISALWSKDGDQDGRMLFGWQSVQAEIYKLTSRPSIITTDYRSASALAFQLNTTAVTVVSQRISHFNFYQPNQLPNILLWDDWYPLTEIVRQKLNIDFSRQTTISIYRFGVFIKNYYLAPILSTTP
ncbi:MAG: ArnT family glycosyltransferase [Pseudanabaenaceae cyanobacterium]